MKRLELDVARQKFLVGHAYFRGTGQHLHNILVGVDAAHLAALDDAVDFACALSTLAILDEEIILPSQSMATHASLRDVIAQFEKTVVAKSVETVYALKCIVEGSPNVAFLRRLDGVKRPVYPFPESVKIELEINRPLPCHFVRLELSFPANPFKHEHPVYIIESLAGHILVIFNTIPEFPSNVGHAKYLHQMLLRPFRHILIDLVSVILNEPAGIFFYLLVKHAGASGSIVCFEVHKFELRRYEPPVISVACLVLVPIDDELDRFIHIDAVAGEHLLPDGLVKSFECVNAIFGIVVECALGDFESVGKHAELPLKRNVVAILVDENACDKAGVAPAFPQLLRNPWQLWGDDHAVLAVNPTLVDHLVKCPGFVEDAPVLLGFHQTCAFEQAGVWFKHDHVVVINFYIGVVSLAGAVPPNTFFHGFGSGVLMATTLLPCMVVRGTFSFGFAVRLQPLFLLVIDDGIAAIILMIMGFLAACPKKHAFELREFLRHFADGVGMALGLSPGKFELVQKAVYALLILFVLRHERPDELHVTFMLPPETFYGFHQLFEFYPVALHFQVQRYAKELKSPNEKLH